MLALVSLAVIIKVSGRYHEEREREEGQEKGGLQVSGELELEHRVGAGEKVKRGQIPLTPVPGATSWDACHILR